MKILLSSNKEIITKYIEQGAKIGFIATASELDDDRWYMEKDKKDLANMNFKIIDIDITNEDKDSIIEKFNSVDAIFVAGGNCFYLLQQLKMKKVLEDLIEFANSKIYVGSSAGSCIACPSIEYVEKLDDKTQAPLLKDYNAMNLIDAYILPHYNSKEKYTKLADEIINENSNLKFIKLSNDQAVIVNDRNDYKIINTN
ncbi:MAG: Type 1 glutamine amidotransferase-like domain-containing protein [Clostridia bacterium]|nr:Type 1 glutamine amidotransferase-like domain-containing protein [Clostridia bacterium]